MNAAGEAILESGSSLVSSPTEHFRGKQERSSLQITFSWVGAFHCKERLWTFPYPLPSLDVMHLPHSPWAGIIKLFSPRESLVSDIPARGGNIANLFLRCRYFLVSWPYPFSSTSFFHAFQQNISPAFMSFRKSREKNTTKSSLFYSNLIEFSIRLESYALK